MGEEWKDKAFSPEEFVASRLHLPISRLKTDLASSLGTLKNELIELINRDYADFINLSTNLVGVDRLILNISGPVDSIKKATMEVRNYLETMISTLKNHLIIRTEIRGKKKIARIKETLTLKLSQSLRECLVTVYQSPSDQVAAAALSQYLRTYVLIDRPREAGLVIEEAIVDPFFAEIFAPHTTTPEAARSDVLENIYLKVIIFVKESCDHLLEICAASFKDGLYDPLTEAIFVKFVKLLTKKMGFIFNPGIPEIFHKKWNLSVYFQIR
ncbi:Conserved oligomeric Golgi complex subunit 2 [Phlyctochytrium bullatum]|nr:Conserved oligomeric Golgi complex subunit 2 [Phlyctochytrium bullatum]